MNETAKRTMNETAIRTTNETAKKTLNETAKKKVNENPNKQRMRTQISNEQLAFNGLLGPGALGLGPRPRTETEAYSGGLIKAALIRRP